MHAKFHAAEKSVTVQKKQKRQKKITQKTKYPQRMVG